MLSGMFVASFQIPTRNRNLCFACDVRYMVPGRVFICGSLKSSGDFVVGQMGHIFDPW